MCVCLNCLNVYEFSHLRRGPNIKTMFMMKETENTITTERKTMELIKLNETHTINDLEYGTRTILLIKGSQL